MKNIRTYLIIGVGIISIILSIRCFCYKSLGHESSSVYGGDAFTGIQNAAAATSKNIEGLASIVQFGFGSVLLVTGLGFLTVGLTSPLKKEDE